MSEVAKFNVIFRGDIVLGHNLVDVKARLQQLFKADAAKIDALFTGRPIPLKKNLDEASAKKYHHVLTQAGAEVSLVPVADAPPIKSAKAPVEKPVAATQSQTAPAAAEVQEPSGLTLAPAGADVLKADERKPVVEANIDVSGITLRESAGNLLDGSEVPAQTITPVQVPDYDVAEAGADMVRDDEKNDLPMLEIEIDDWDLSEVGGDLIKAEERVAPEKVEVQDLNVDLAPVGSDLGQLKEEIEPVNPDISKLKLVDE